MLPSFEVDASQFVEFMQLFIALFVHLQMVACCCTKSRVRVIVRPKRDSAAKATHLVKDQRFDAPILKVRHLLVRIGKLQL